MVETLTAGGLCDDYRKNETDKTKLEASCSKKDRADASTVIAMSSLFKITPLDSRADLCLRVKEAVDVLSNQTQVCSPSPGNRLILGRLIEVGRANMARYCVPVDYEPAGCKPQLFGSCVEAFSTVSSYAVAEPGPLCRAATSALECLSKFSRGCIADKLIARDAFWERVRTVIGNSCPNLTLGLFCPEKYPLRNNFTCSFEKAKGCLPTSGALGLTHRLRGNQYCMDLDISLKCAKRGLEGCLLSQVSEAKTKLSSLTSLPAELRYCQISAAVSNYQDTCIAANPCSVGKAIDCLDSVEDSSAVNCTTLQQVRVCLDAALAFCTKTESALTVYNLFHKRFRKAVPGNCTAPFNSLPSETAVSDVFACTRQLSDALVDSLVTARKTQSVCQALRNYKTCVGNVSSADSGSGASLLIASTSYVDDVLDGFCVGSGVDASSTVPSETCRQQLTEAAQCILQEVLWVLKRHLFTSADKSKFCGRWNQQTTSSCVIQRVTGSCEGSIQRLMEAAVDLSTRLVIGSRACDALKICYLREAYYNINQFSVAVAKYTADGDTKKLCLEQLQAKDSLSDFTASCSEDQQAMAVSSLKQVSDLVEDACRNFYPPPSPICPAVPQEQQQCSVGRAFSCIVDFNKAILSHGPSLIWREWCTTLQGTLRCAALNTSSCDMQMDSMSYVVESLADLRDQAGSRCPWLSPDLCSRETPCPAQYAGCDVELQLDLLNFPLDDVCSHIQKAEKCVGLYAATCTRAQRSVAEEAIKRRLRDLSLPPSTCDGTKVTPCLLRARAASWQLLTQFTTRSTGCNVLQEATVCIQQRAGVSNVSRQLQVARDLAGTVMTGLQNRCSTPSPCGEALAPVVNSVYDWLIQLSSAPEFDVVGFCSKRLAVLTDIEVTKEQYTPNCTLSELAGLVKTLSTGVLASQCGADATAECPRARSEAQACLANMDLHNLCSSVNAIVVCLAPALGLCPTNDALISSFRTLISTLADCVRPPLIGLSTSTRSPLYVSEEGGSVSIKFRIVENLSAYSSVPVQVRVRAEVAERDPLSCLGDNSKAVPQLSVIYNGLEQCGARVSEDGWNSDQQLGLVAALDGRQDGLRQVNVTLYADLYYRDNNQSAPSWIKNPGSFRLATYSVNVEDADVTTAVCSSSGDPHIKSFDGTLINNFEVGEFVMYRNSKHATAVTVSYQQCATTGTCACAVEVLAPRVRVRFDRCRRVGATGPPEDISVTMDKTGDPSTLAVYRHPDLKKYYIVLASGTIVTVKAGSLYLNVWITPSTADFGKTEGLCGLFDGNAYNDLLQPDGQRYVTINGDMQYGVLSPRGFINQWNVENLPGGSVVNPRASVDLVPSCSCPDSNPSASQCGYITKVATCDFIQGVDITRALSEAADLTSGSGVRRRRAIDSDIDFTSSIPPETAQWRTPSNWTEGKAQEHCERVLEQVLALRYCDKAVLAANATDMFDYADVITMCVGNIRMSDSADYDDLTVQQALLMYSMMFLRDTSLQSVDGLRDVIMQCLDQTCANDCNGNGRCQLGVCSCEPGYTGGDCLYRRTNLPRPWSPTLLHSEICSVSGSNTCTSVFLSGRDLVESPFLSCHFQAVQISSLGTYTTIGTETVVKAELLTATVLHCPIPRASAAHQTLIVSFSNDGIHAAASWPHFTVHDPRCYTCDPSTHYCTKAVPQFCEIEGRCYMAEEDSPSDSCLICDPARSSAKWSYRKLPECEVPADQASKDDTSERLTVVHIAIISATVALVAVAVILIAACLIKRRRNTKTKKVWFGAPEHGAIHYPSIAMDNPAYACDTPTSDTVNPNTQSPQEVFCQGSIHKRFVNRHLGSEPTALSVVQL